MSRFYDFGACLAQKDMDTLYGLLHCLHGLVEACKDDASRLGTFLRESNMLELRQCDMCGEHMTLSVVQHMLTVVEQTIEQREREARLTHPRND